MNTETVGAETPENYDAHETAKPDEPTFTVQGGDELGPPTVLFWAEAARKLARGILNGVRAGFVPEFEGQEYTPTERDMVDADVLYRKATSAERRAWEMTSYLKGQQVDRIDESVFVDPEQKIETRTALIRSVGRLHNALAESNDVAILLAEHDVHRDAEVIIREAVEQLRIAAQMIEPRRGNERS